MTKPLLCLFCVLLTLPGVGQEGRKVSVYLGLQGSTTLYDRTLSNNRGGIGVGLQGWWQTASIIRPVLELTGETFAGTKELYLLPDGTPIEAKSTAVNILAGGALQPGRKFYLSVAAGPSFINGAAHLAVKPTMGYYFSNNGLLGGKASFTNVFYKDDVSKESFGYLSFALSIKLFDTAPKTTTTN